MSLSTEEKNELKDLIRDTMVNECMCPHNDELVQLMGRLETLGKGNVKHGIESFARTIEMMTRIRKRGEDIGGKVAIFIIVTIVGGIFTLLTKGFISYLK